MPIEKQRPSESEIQAGQAVFNTFTLKLYDFWVLKFTNHLIWCCPTSAILEWYNRYITSNHLDVGIGTGYYLDHCCFPNQKPRLALMDMNPDTIAFCSKRLYRYHPQTYLHNIFEPFSFSEKKFDSVGLNYVLHCLPGNMKTKESVIQNLWRFLKPKGVLFGSTLIMRDISLSFRAKYFMNLYNRKKIFCNREDTLEDLKEVLGRHFDKFQIQLIGCVALFSAIK